MPAEAQNVIRERQPEHKSEDKETSNFPPGLWSSIGPATSKVAFSFGTKDTPVAADFSGWVGLVTSGCTGEAGE